MRRIAVFATKVLPKIRREYGSDYGGELADMFASPPPALFIVSVFLLLFLLTAAAAYRADRRTLYVARAPEPFYPTSLAALFYLQLRVHMSLLRGFNIVPGYVPYTRLQALAPSLPQHSPARSRFPAPSRHAQPLCAPPRTHLSLLVLGARPRRHHSRDQRLLRAALRRCEQKV